MRARLFHSVLLAGLAALLLASSALAAKPTKVPLPAPGSQVFAAGTGYCDFDVELDWTVNREFGIVTTFADGSSLVRVAGSVEIVVTNLANGKSIPWNAGGPGVAAFDPSGTLTRFEGRGHALVYGPLEPLQSAGIIEYTGKADFLNGTFTGRRTDVCAALS
jgi:hypothetical protein